MISYKTNDFFNFTKKFKGIFETNVFEFESLKIFLIESIRLEVILHSLAKLFIPKTKTTHCLFKSPSRIIATTKVI